MGYPAAAQLRSFGSRAITSGQTKTPEPTTALLGLLSWAPAFNALASLDMQDDLLFAVPAENRQAIRLGLRGDPQQSPVSAAYRAGDPSVHYGQLTTLIIYSQAIFLRFFRICELFN